MVNMASTSGKPSKTSQKDKISSETPQSMANPKKAAQDSFKDVASNTIDPNGDARSSGSDNTSTKHLEVPEIAAEDQFDFLVGLLTGSQQEEIEEIKEKIDDLPLFVDRLSEALPEAIIKRGDDRLMIQAFTPVVQKTLDAATQGDPDEFARRLLPSIRRSIRMIVEETVDKVVTQLNYSLEHSLNIRWRIEALQSGRPFSEVVLAHTLKYRVEQVLLIHKETGLLLNQVNHEEGSSEDGDLISSMLSAIQSFIQDSFKVGNQSQLENVRMGDFELFIEQEKDVVIAAAVRGVPTADLEHVLEDATNYLQLVFDKELKSFDGDTSVFEDTEDTLRACLKSDFEVPSKKPNPILIAALSALGLFIVLSLGFNIYRGQQWRGYINTLKSEAGIMVTQENRRGGRYEISGLRDSYAKDPTELLKLHNINPQKVTAKWEGYAATDPILLEQRLKATLKAPATALISVDSNRNVIFKGYACENWSSIALTLTRMLPGVNQVDTSAFESVQCN